MKVTVLRLTCLKVSSQIGAPMRKVLSTSFLKINSFLGHLKHREREVDLVLSLSAGL